MHKLCALLLALSLPHWADASMKATTLSKIFHNTYQSSDNQKHVELGEATFVFSDGLVVNQLSTSHQKESGTLRFFVPGGIVQSSLKGTKEIISPQKNVYKITMRAVSAPINGIQFDVEYDPARVVFARDMFQRVTRERKLVFRFYDKQLLDKIQSKKEVPMIVHAALDPTVIIDSGHGGHDFGVVGCANVAEKNICLAVGKKVAEELKKKGIQAILTRNQDEYISLDQRVLHTKQINPQLFISIHANAAGNQKVSGIETYYFDRRQCTLQKDQNSAAVFLDEYQKSLTLKNKQLAQALQQTAYKSMVDTYAHVVDRKIKPEPLQVLMGARIPAALIEIGFLTNEQEANLLSQDIYQSHMARGICNGIISFLAINNETPRMM